MKFILISIGIIAAVSAAPANEDGPQCQAPDGGGLMPVLQEFKKLIPVDQIMDMYMNAISNDQEIQETMEYLSSDEFQKIIMSVRNLPDFNLINDFACKKLYFDAIYYQNLLNDILGLPLIPRPPFMSFQQGNRHGLRGLFQDIIDLIPIEQLRLLFKEKLQSDEYVKRAVELIHTTEFRNIIDTLRQQPEFIRLMTVLQEKGFQIDEAIDFIRKILGINLN